MRSCCMHIARMGFWTRCINLLFNARCQTLLEEEKSKGLKQLTAAETAKMAALEKVTQLQEQLADKTTLYDRYLS